MPSTIAVPFGGVPLPIDLLAGAPGGAGQARSAAGSAAASDVAAARSPTMARSSIAKATTTAKKTTAAKATTTTKKTATASKTTAAAAKKVTGYATKLPAEFSFLRDPKLSIEEKLSRFIGLLMAKSEQELLAQMERMAPGSTPAATATGKPTGSGSTGPAAPKPKTTKFSLWGLAKAILPPLNLASQLIGDAKLKSLISQVSGPVLGAAATAIGLPELAPLAVKYGPTLVGALTKEVAVDAASAVSSSAASETASGSAAASAAKASSTAAADPATSEKAQLMELQRLQDRDKELFTLFSNMLKAMHDARMTSIQNIR